MTITEIYQGAERLINEILRNEFAAQGHTLSGAAEASLSMVTSHSGKQETMTGTMVDYARYVRDGVPAASASMKQFPFLVKYFVARGFPSKDDGVSNPDTLTAESLSAMTIRKWMKEGMSTQASKRFSKTGSRQHFVESAFAGKGHQVDEYMSKSFDFAVNEYYLKEKSETI